MSYEDSYCKSILFREDGVTGFKYVIMENGEVRIGNGYVVSHKGMANGEKAVAAGFLSYHPARPQDSFPETVSVNGYSMTTGLHSREGVDEPLILAEIQRIKANTPPEERIWQDPVYDD